MRVPCGQWPASVQHWTLEVDGHFIGSTSNPLMAEHYHEIAKRLNENVVPSDS